MHKVVCVCAVTRFAACRGLLGRARASGQRDGTAGRIPLFLWMDTLGGLAAAHVLVEYGDECYHVRLPRGAR